MNNEYENIVDSITKRNLKSLELITFYQQELNKQKKQILKLEYANKIKLEFIYHLANDFIMSLHTIKDLAILIRNKNLNNKICYYFCKNIINISEHLFQLVNHSLEMIHNESNNITLNYENFNPAEIIAEVLCILNEQLKEKNIIVDTQLCHFEIYADKQRFKQLIYNLVENAYKFNRNSGKIDIKSTLIENNFYFEIKDTGCGISIENQNKIFDFFSSFNNKEKTIDNFGIGLAMCKKIIESHGGHIEFESIPKQGTTFWLYFPINPMVKRQNSYITFSKKL